MMHSGEKLNAIIVDDVPDFLAGLRFFLEEVLDCNVIGEASTGIELLKHTLLYDADFILIDCEMPGLNGIETARLLNFRYPSKKLIALTMYQDEICLNDLITAGFSGYVYKPDIVSKLESVINNVLKNELDFSRALKIKRGMPKTK